MSIQIEAAPPIWQTTADAGQYDTTVIITCAGVIDMATAPDLERHIALALEKRPASIIVDLTQTELLTSHGMHILAATHAHCAPTIRFAVVADGPGTSRPMKVVGLTDIITLHATLDEAMNRASV